MALYQIIAFKTREFSSNIFVFKKTNSLLNLIVH